MLVELFNKVIMPQMRIWFGLQKGLTSDGRAKYWNESMDNIEAFERELSSRGAAFFGGDQPGWLDYMVWPWFERIDSYSVIFKVRENITTRGESMQQFTGGTRVPKREVSWSDPVDDFDAGGPCCVRLLPGHGDTCSLHTDSRYWRRTRL